ncbi:MAG: peptidylprolyl isomerase [Clostridia bacterium]|nr:peptidylprolyl isomerase [Clostridia bacterium]
MVEITMRDGGVIKLELYPDVAPITVENFTKLASEGFYDGLIFHRVIKGFMIQGGDPEGTGMGGSDTNIKGEFAVNGVANNISHVRGVISMARARSYNSASSQFFIVHRDSTYLDGQYAAFGRVIEGMEVVDAIAEVPTNGNDRPLTEQVIETLRVIQE